MWVYGSCIHSREAKKYRNDIHFVSLMLISLYVQYTNSNNMRSVTVWNISVCSGQVVQ